CDVGSAHKAVELGEPAGVAALLSIVIQAEVDATGHPLNSGRLGQDVAEGLHHAGGVQGVQPVLLDTMIRKSDADGPNVADLWTGEPLQFGYEPPLQSTAAFRTGAA